MTQKTQAAPLQRIVDATDWCFTGYCAGRAALEAAASPTPAPSLLHDYQALCDIWQECNALGTVLGDHERLQSKIAKLRDEIGSRRAERAAVPALEPTSEMIDAGAQRLVSWEEGSVWPDSWSPLQVAAARNEAERVWRSMWLAAMPCGCQIGTCESKPEMLCRMKAEIGAAVPASVVPAELLRRCLAYIDEPAGITIELIRDKPAFTAHMQAIEREKRELGTALRAALAAGQPSPKETER